eukprot:TRINITY_DN4035_c0_g1_i1.p1 TRINITY_DN4035_c0_g1~~TRINITY_DN4035_c0_g1_i1.p1  ORF type:complete len:101 (+),score=25.53 TRINITY_DN4035_c0_g1_i1:62-364(+)
MNGANHLHQKHIKQGVERLDRQSGTGNRGTPRKGGGGGKHHAPSWGVPGQEYEEPVPAALDQNDPNWVDEPEDMLKGGEGIKVGSPKQATPRSGSLKTVS